MIEPPVKKVTTFLGQYKNPLAWILMMAVGILFWTSPETFLWRDDWKFLQFFQSDSHPLYHHFASDVMPLFQYFLFAEFSSFGTAFHDYQFVSVILLTASCIATYQLMLAFGVPFTFALPASLLYLAHPTNFVNACWIIQQSELIHTALVLFSFLAYRMYTVSPGILRLGSFATCLLLQSFFFPNGVFYPLLFLVLEILRARRNFDRPLVTIASLIFLVHVVHSLYISQGLPPRESAALLDTLPEKAIFFLSFAGNSITRLVVPNAPYAPQSMIQWLGLIVMIGVVGWTLYRRQQNELLMPAVLALFTASIAISIFRSTNAVIPYYYTSLQVPFLFLILVSLAHSMFYRIHKSALYLFLVIILVGFGFADRAAMKIFAGRNRDNRLRLERALQTGGPYEPGDDPALALPGYISVDGKSSGETAVILYRQLKRTDH